MVQYFDFEVSLLEVEPRIWRRFLIRSEAIRQFSPSNLAGHLYVHDGHWLPIGTL